MNDNNEAKVIKKLMKKDFNKLGITLLVQELIAYGIIVLVAIGITIIQMIKNPNVSEDQLIQIFEQPSFTGTMSIIAVVIAFIPILIYRQKKFFQYDLKVVNRKFTVKTVILGFIILFSLNSTIGLFANVLELGLNEIGLSAISALKELEVLNQPTISMIVYTCIMAPIFEEFIYRGAVLRSLEKYGRKFAILISAILFGLMHGNFYQIFMAAGIGIVLGYLATEYSIKLTILLHMCNNICVELLSEITSHIGENAGGIIDLCIMVASIIILVVAFIFNKNHIKEWLQNNKMEKRIMLRFLTSITVIIIIAIDLFMVVSGIKNIL